MIETRILGGHKRRGENPRWVVFLNLDPACFGADQKTRVFGGFEYPGSPVFDMCPPYIVSSCVPRTLCLAISPETSQINATGSPGPAGNICFSLLNIHALVRFSRKIPTVCLSNAWLEC